MGQESVLNPKCCRVLVQPCSFIHLPAFLVSFSKASLPGVWLACPPCVWLLVSFQGTAFPLLCSSGSCWAQQLFAWVFFFFFLLTSSKIFLELHLSSFFNSCVKRSRTPRRDSCFPLHCFCAYTCKLLRKCIQGSLWSLSPCKTHQVVIWLDFPPLFITSSFVCLLFVHNLKMKYILLLSIILNCPYFKIVNL